MRKLLITSVLFLFILVVQISTAHAVYVSGYYRSNGTYVNGYERTAPDGNPYNNYSYPGNYNPNTGSITGGSDSTYLNNYYSSGSSGSTYYSSPTSYSSYSYPTTPTCPLNSYYDGISTCKCNYGYVVSGGSCVSANSICYNQLGYSSSYDSTSNTCKCDYGYVIGSSGQCTSGTNYCYSKTGYESTYDSSSNTCKCNSGYVLNTLGQCVAQAPLVPQISTTNLTSKSAVVVYEKYSCDYFIVKDSGGDYDLLEWYSGYDPSSGDILKGNFHTYGFHDFYNSSYTRKTHVWIEDWLLTWDDAISQYKDKCN